MRDNLIKEGLESIDRVKLLMGYNLKKTLSENKEILLEQSTPTIYLYDPTTKRWKFSWKERYNNPEYPKKSTEGCPFYKEVDGFKKCAEDVILIKDAKLKYALQNIDYSKKNINQSNIPQNIPTSIIPYPQQVYVSPVDNPQYTNPKNPIFGKWKAAFQKEHPDYVFDPLPPLKPEAEIPWWYNLISLPSTIQLKYYNQNRDRFDYGGNRFVKLPPTGQGKIDKEQQRIIGLRTNKWGENVPFGFHPDEYHEYLQKVMETNAFYDKLNSQIQSSKVVKPTTDYNDPFGKNSNYQKSDVLGSGHWGTYIKNQNIMSSEAKVTKSREETLDALYKAYYHPSHPMGITQSQLISYEKGKKSLPTQMQHEIDSIKTFYKDFKPYTECTNCIPNSMATRNGGNPNLVYHAENPEMLRKIEEIKGKYEAAGLFLDIVYEYDPAGIKEINKTFMQRLWEDYGLVAELAIWIGVDVLTDGWAASISAGRQAWLLTKVGKALGVATDPQKIAKIVTFAGKVGLPVAAGVASIIENKQLTEDAVMLFLIAMLPYIHDVVGLLKKPSPELVGRLVSNIGKYDLKSEEGLRNFVRSISQEEKDLYREIISMSKSDMIKGVEKAKNLIGNKSYDYFMKAYDEGLDKVISLKPKRWYNTVGKFGLRIAADLSFIEVVKKLVELFGWTKKDIEQKKLAESLENYRRDHPSPEQFFSYTMLLGSIIAENPNIELAKLLQDAKTKTNEYLAKNPDDKIKTMDSLLSNSSAFVEMFDMLIEQEKNNK